MRVTLQRVILGSVICVGLAGCATENGGSDNTVAHFEQLSLQQREVICKNEAPKGERFADYDDSSQLVAMCEELGVDMGRAAG